MVHRFTFSWLIAFFENVYIDSHFLKCLDFPETKNWSFSFPLVGKSASSGFQTLPKAQRTPGLSSAYQSNFFRSYHKFLHKSWSNIFRISTKHQLQNLNQASAFWRNLNSKLFDVFTVADVDTEIRIDHSFDQDLWKNLWYDLKKLLW